MSVWVSYLSDCAQKLCFEKQSPSHPGSKPAFLSYITSLADGQSWSQLLWMPLLSALMDFPSANRCLYKSTRHHSRHPAWCLFPVPIGWFRTSCAAILYVLVIQGIFENLLTSSAYVRNSLAMLMVSRWLLCIKLVQNKQRFWAIPSSSAWIPYQPRYQRSYWQVSKLCTNLWFENAEKYNILLAVMLAWGQSQHGRLLHS